MRHYATLVTLFVLLGTAKQLQAQQVDSIYFHLYTDSLKKGVYNYINVDAKLDNGRWLPLGTKELIFTASSGKWDENNLIIDTSFTGEFVTVTATLKQQPTLTRTTRIYIKKFIDNTPLKTEQQVMEEMKRKRKQ
ncbi:hypothetical protein [Deminuibacter soli]|uniref:Uncharacterized protein n=1 Tax=Deminuibacter soli TaxID=2291815 RepID=A0A3E1NM19_9BACT|nr:hypothetical protein [Deminuibacter soli]RFM28975.1 hypothetical protein DXN05_09435 [Deminuibacter soli]